MGAEENAHRNPEDAERRQMLLKAAPGHKAYRGSDRLAAPRTDVESGLELGPAGVAEHSSPPTEGTVSLLYARRLKKLPKESWRRGTQDEENVDMEIWIHGDLAKSSLGGGRSQRSDFSCPPFGPFSRHLRTGGPANPSGTVRTPYCLLEVHDLSAVEQTGEFERKSA